MYRCIFRSGVTYPQHTRLISVTDVPVGGFLELHKQSLSVAGHEAFVPPLSAVEICAGTGARGRGMRYLFVAYWPDLFVFVGAPTLLWFVFFG
jgi:hypothetical protein